MRYLGLVLICLGLFVPLSAQEVPLSPRITYTPSGGALNRVTYSPDGAWIAVAGRDARTYLYNTTNQSLFHTFDPMNDWVTSIAFSPDSTTLASGSRDGTIWVWDIQTSTLLSRYFPTKAEITSLAFSPDGDILATGSRDGTIILYYQPTQTAFTTLPNYGGAVWDVLFSADGSRLFSASEDGTIWIWGLWDGTLNRLVGHTSPVASLALSENNQLLSGSLDGTVRLWDIGQLSDQIELTESLILTGHLAPILGVTFGERVAFSASLDGTVRIWDITGIIRKGVALGVLKTNAHPLTHLALNPTQDTLATVGTDGNLLLWQVDDQTIVQAFVPRVDNSASDAVLAPISPTAETDNQRNPIQESPALPNSGRFISIPSAGITSSITYFPLGGGTWEIDPYEPLVGHFQGTSWLDTVGNMVLGAHSLYPNGNAGTFFNLYNVGIGDEIFVSDNGFQRRYVVVNIRSVDYRDISVVYPTGFNRVTLITCDIPSYVQEQNLYYARLVVVADEVP